MTLSRVSFAVFCIALPALSGCCLLASSRHPPKTYTPVFAAADACNLPYVKKAVARHPDLLVATEWDNATLLHDAVGHNCTDLTAYLLREGANPNAVRTDGLTPLHLAAERGNVPILHLLINHGAKINAIDKQGWTPLDRAIKWNRPAAASYLRQHGGRQNKTDK